MSYYDTDEITCPYCGHKADGINFEVSCADECFCPQCEAEFLIQEDEESEEAAKAEGE